MFTFGFMKVRNIGRSFCSSRRLPNALKILGIETSCDDTAAAIVDSNKNILGECIYSQAPIHALHGGILPNFAHEIHQDHLEKVVNNALEKSHSEVKDMDAIAVTVKPGINQSLEVGLEHAKALCKLYEKPLIPIHHMHAHALTIRLLENVRFPYLVLLISGGHCISALVESATKFSILGETRDIPPGVVFDQLARRMKLRNIKEFRLMQGGVAIEAAASTGNPLAINFGITHMFERDADFCFSGLLSAVKIYIQKKEMEENIVGDEILPNISDVCASFQFALARHICQRVEISMRYLQYKNLLQEEKVLVLSGGVASNEFIRNVLRRLCDKLSYKFLVPPKNLCTDNGVMVAWNGIELMNENVVLVQPKDLYLVKCSPRFELGQSLKPDIISSYLGGKYVRMKDLINVKPEGVRLTDPVHKSTGVQN